MNRPIRDVQIMLLGLLLLVLWDLSGWDLQTMYMVADTHGFSWRHHWLTDLVLHEGGRWLSWGVWLALCLEALLLIKPGPTRSKRISYLLLIVASAALVPYLKHLSLSSCPWDLTDFGGHASYVSHWRWGVPDGGHGHCFPSGHAVAAFGFLGVYFLWRDDDIRYACIWLVVVLGVGILFGMAQMLRGAHYPSHTLWTAWICWTIFSLASIVEQTLKYCYAYSSR